MDEEPGGTASHKCNSANRPESRDSCPAAETMSTHICPAAETVLTHICPAAETVSTHICPAAETVSDSARLVGRRFKIRVKS